MQDEGAGFTKQTCVQRRERRIENVVPQMDVVSDVSDLSFPSLASPPAFPQSSSPWPDNDA